MLVRVADPQRAHVVLEAAGITARIDGDLLRVHLPPSEGARISETLARAGLYPSELRPDAVDLETVFLELTGDEAAA